MAKPVLRAVFLDIDDTLYASTQFAQAARRSGLQAMLDLGLKGDLEVLYQELLEVVAEFSSNDGHHYDKLLLRLPSESFAGINPALLVASAVVAYHRTKADGLRVFDGVYPCLRYLRRYGVLIGIISSGRTIKQAEKLVRLGVLPYLHPEGVFISEQIGIDKPNPKIFEKVLKRFRLSPGEVMYIGDHPQKDILPAHRLGICTVWMLQGSRYRGQRGVPAMYILENYTQLLEVFQQDFELCSYDGFLRSDDD
ncbi:MAG: HAD family hydrolase [Planctomycetota bacterium]|nr:MAG: HAD family hydrolase [Planctomycetota bacterium]